MIKQFGQVNAYTEYSQFFARIWREEDVDENKHVIFSLSLFSARAIPQAIASVDLTQYYVACRLSRKP